MPSKRSLEVRFEPHARTVFASHGAKVIEAAARAGLTIDTPCGGDGTCGACRVKFEQGGATPSETEQRMLGDDQTELGWRLACRSEINSDCVIRVPESSLFAGVNQILETSSTRTDHVLHPAVRKVPVALPAPTLTDAAADLERLERVTGPLEAELSMTQALSLKVRDCGFHGTAVLSGQRLIDFEPGDTTAVGFGVAVNVGTTTLVGSLLDLQTGEEVALASGTNPQVAYGDDVLSRIKHASLDDDGVEQLRSAVVDEIARIVHQLCGSAQIPAERIYDLVLAGNTTMQHLLCGIDPSPLGRVPFVPTHARGLQVAAKELGISIHPRAAVFVFPLIRGFLGGDTVAGILATRMRSDKGPVLMVDLGTNGEIALAHDGRLWAASTAAGPAFEGARIACGVRATRGAIERVSIGGDVELSVIGAGRPLGLCGSALIDVAAELLECGLITPEGRMLRAEEVPERTSAALRERLQADERGRPRFVLSDAGPSAEDPSVFLTQRDVRELQLASGAIRTGIRLLARRAGVRLQDLRSVLLAGGFGSFIRRSRAQRMGLIPPEIAHNRVHFVGNTALAAAQWAVLSTAARATAEEIARRTEAVELALEPDFQHEFTEAMLFPAG